MVCCSAQNCNSHTRHGIYKFYRFPADDERRKLWIMNCDRPDWLPTPTSRLCNLHFDEMQFEQNRFDGRQKLSPRAVPTIFNITSNKKPRKRKSTKSKPNLDYQVNVECEYILPHAYKEEPNCDELVSAEMDMQYDEEFMSVNTDILALQKQLDSETEKLLMAQQNVHSLQLQLMEKYKVLQKFQRFE